MWWIKKWIKQGFVGVYWLLRIEGQKFLYKVLFC
ncbi:MAG: hypothetical protein MRERV_6c015 [Mycoplasmataceae bacterium RV_VA103A]|nr:MAG: hypothetical protein MRERV_6c015 [Mycoplasmataceae bacterium RV_VA103A]